MSGSHDKTPRVESPVPVVTVPAVTRDWVSKVYPRFHLTAPEITLLLQRFLPNEILTTKDMQHEFNSMQTWLAANPARAARKRSWYRFALNWLSVAEERLRSKPGRRATRSDDPQRTSERAERIRAYLEQR